jgi:hypothetical protein
MIRLREELKGSSSVESASYERSMMRRLLKKPTSADQASAQTAAPAQPAAPDQTTAAAASETPASPE